MFSASQAARASRSLVNRIGSIERLAQQMSMLDDPELAARLRRACTAASSRSPTSCCSCRSTTRSAPRWRRRWCRSRRSTTCSPGRRPGAHDPRAHRPAHRRAGGERLRGARHQQPGRRPRGDAPAGERGDGAAPAGPAGAVRHRGGARHRARPDALHRAPDRRARRRDPAARRRRFLAPDHGARPGGPAVRWASASTGCAAGWTSSRRRRTASCATCLTS